MGRVRVKFHKRLAKAAFFVSRVWRILEQSDGVRAKRDDGRRVAQRGGFIEALAHQGAAFGGIEMVEMIVGAAAGARNPTFAL